MYYNRKRKLASFIHIMQRCGFLVVLRKEIHLSSDEWCRNDNACCCFFQAFLRFDLSLQPLFFLPRIPSSSFILIFTNPHRSLLLRSLLFISLLARIHLSFFLSSPIPLPLSLLPLVRHVYSSQYPCYREVRSGQPRRENPSSRFRQESTSSQR